MSMAQPIQTTGSALVTVEGSVAPQSPSVKHPGGGNQTYYDFPAGKARSDYIESTGNAQKIPADSANQNATLLGVGVSSAAKGIEASVDARKFSDYIFKSGADHGKDAVFKTLGYSAEDSATLAATWEKQAAEKFAKGEYSFGKVDQYGQRIDIEIVLPGKGSATGQTSYLKSGWMIQPDGTIKLNTPFSGFTRSRK